MKIEKFNNTHDWLEARRGRITGTRAGSLVGKRDGKDKKGFYEIIAERVAIPHDGENVLDRGHRLEIEAIERFEKETGKKVNKDLVIMSRDDNNAIAYSPDGFIGKTEDVEVKCLNSASHIEAWYTKSIPSDYWDQVIQGFVVNDKLKRRNIVFYDPRMPKDFFYIIVNRSDVKDEIKEYLDMERNVLEVVSLLEEQLTF